MLLDQKENEMNKDQLLKIDLMKTMAAAKGYDADAPGIELDFRMGSAFYRSATMIIEKFDIKKKIELDNSSNGRKKTRQKKDKDVSDEVIAENE